MAADGERKTTMLKVPLCIYLCIAIPCAGQIFGACLPSGPPTPRSKVKRGQNEKEVLASVLVSVFLLAKVTPDHSVTCTLPTFPGRKKKTKKKTGYVCIRTFISIRWVLSDASVFTDWVCVCTSGSWCREPPTPFPSPSGRGQAVCTSSSCNSANTELDHNTDKLNWSDLPRGMVSG